MLEGRYKGTVLSPWWLKPAGLVWKGKIFKGDKVINLIGPIRMIRGKVEELAEGFYTITYPGGLVDFLTVGKVQEEVWGLLKVAGVKIKFKLTKEKSRGNNRP